MRPITLSLVLTLLAATGCSNGKLTLFSKDPENPHDTGVAYAANVKYPADVKATTDLTIAAMFNDKDANLRIVNLSDKVLTDAKIWVNGVYVRNLPSMAAHTTKNLPYTDFFNSAGQDMATQKVTPAKVEIQTADHLYRLEGPAEY